MWGWLNPQSPPVFGFHSYPHGPGFQAPHPAYTPCPEHKFITAEGEAERRNF